ncbi:integrase/recombinase xerD homolog [Leptodactylus fuscus]
MNSGLAGLAFGFKSRGLKDFTKSFLVQRAVKGWRHFRALEDDRKPVSFSLLMELGSVVGEVCTDAGEGLLFRAAFSLAFFGAFRLGELVSGSRSQPGGLFWEDVDVYEDRVDVQLRRSKTDQEAKGCRCLFEVPRCCMCPVLCTRTFLLDRGGATGPLLVHKDGTFLSRFQFLGVFRKCLHLVGRGGERFCGHSFRIGAATEAARWGLGEEVIKRIGRWESVRFRSYIHPEGLV